MYFLSEEVSNNQQTKVFKKVASKILKQQGKLGQIQGMTVTVKSLTESNLKRLVKDGALAIVPVTAAALYINKSAEKCASNWFKREEGEHKDLIDKMNAHHERERQSIAEFDKYVDKSEMEERAKKKQAWEQKHNDKIAELDKDHGDRMNKGKKFWKATRVASVTGSASLVNLPFFVNFIRKGTKQEILINVRYKYGTKVFKVYDASKRELRAGIDKIILKIIGDTIKRLKTEKDFPIKEDVTLEEFKQINLTESELESVMDWM